MAAIEQTFPKLFSSIEIDLYWLNDDDNDDDDDDDNYNDNENDFILYISYWLSVLICMVTPNWSM